MKVLAQNFSLPWTKDGKDISLPVTGIEDFKFNNLGKLVSDAMPYVFAAAGIGLLLMILGAGFAFMTSAGDSKKLGEAQQRLTYAVVGFLVIFAAFWLTQIVGTIFGICEFSIFSTSIKPCP